MNVYLLIMILLLLVLLAEVTVILTKMPRSTLKTKRRAVLVDTSVLMDGRIVSIAKTGFIGDTLVIPRSVVGELQLVADNSDNEKRARARSGLDVVAELQALPDVDVELLQDGASAREGVDNRLIALAKQHGALIMTIDFNLSKVAHVEGIAILNINDLSQGIRMAHLPGEHLKLEIVQNGQDNHQGVGYLEDGTMVVVEQSRAYVGKIVEVEIIRSLQTSAGKMMFAKRINSQTTHKNQNSLPHQEESTKLARKTSSGAQQHANIKKDKPRQAAASNSPSHTPNQKTSSRSTARQQPRRKKDRESILIELAENQ